MPRPRLCRRIGFEPNITYFKPAGIRMVELEESVLTVDEFEAIRLKDMLGMDQEQAAKKMNISQPTFHRLILSARKRIADAIVNGKAIKIQGGVYKTVPELKQPMRGMGRGGRKRRGFGGPAMICVCTACGHQITKQRGIPCASLVCPKCNNLMVRG